MLIETNSESDSSSDEEWELLEKKNRNVIYVHYVIYFIFIFIK